MGNDHWDEVTGDPVQSASEKCGQKVQWVRVDERKEERFQRGVQTALQDFCCMVQELRLRGFISGWEEERHLCATRKTVMGRT